MSPERGVRPSTPALPVDTRGDFRMSLVASRRAIRARQRRRRSWGRTAQAVATLAIATLFAPFLVMHGATAAEGDPDEPVLIQFEKDAIPAAPTAVEPAETVTYQFTINCSSLETDCLDLTLTDVVPEPLELQSVTTAQSIPPVSTTINGNEFTVEIIEDLGGGFTGLQAGTGIQVNATATVPADLAADWDGVTLDNTATVTVSNREDLSLDPPRPSAVQSSAQVVLAVTRSDSSSVSKSVTPASTPAILGRDVDFTLGAVNTSNGSVDELVIQEPADPSADTLDWLEITALSGLTLPAGADRVRVDWFDGTDWVTGTPAATADLPSGIDTANIRGLRFVFSSSTGRVERGGTAAITVETQLTAAAAAIESSRTVTNTASSWVTFQGESTTPVTASDGVVLEPSSIGVGATKQFSTDSVVGGQQLRLTVGGQNGGDFGLESMTITEPSPGSTSLADQGISFDEWVDADIEWPVGATSALVSYLYEGEADFSAPVTVTTPDTLADPVDADAVAAVRVEFRSTLPGGIAPGQYARLPMLVTTDAVESDDTTQNEVRVDVVTLDDESASAVATDDLTRRNVRVNTFVNKLLTPDEIYSFAGSSVLVQLPAGVTPLPVAAIDPSASTIGAEHLTVQDPLVPGSDEFWNYFDLTDIVATAIPANALLTVQYHDGVEWLDLPDAVDLAGPGHLTMSIPSGLRDTVHGVRFQYRHVDFDAQGTLLAPGFTAQPNVRFALRDELRDGTGEAASSTREVELPLVNPVRSIVVNDNANPTTATADGTAPVVLLPVAGGAGIAGIQKTWLDTASTGTDAVNARSNDRAVVLLEWGTAGVGYPSVVISDTASDPATTPVSETVFEAFDLVRVLPITDDPYLQYDEVVAVELYREGLGWVATSSNPCASSACVGAFPGYTLTATERADTLGVRLVLQEGPQRASLAGDDPFVPPVGSGVAATMDLDRQIRLEFEVRDVRRSDAQIAVLGSTREALYNVDGEFGRVDNSARVEGRNLEGESVLDLTDSDTILILDNPITIDITKSWVDGPLGTPPDGTPQAFFPRARMTVVASNESVSRVDELSVHDPVAGTDPFDAVNMYDIVTLTVPSGATSSTVYLTQQGGAVDEYTVAAALALSSATLAQYVAIEVVHTGRIAVDAETRIVIDTQLREFLRSEPTTRVTSADSPVSNTAEARIVDPGGITTPPEGETVNTLIAQDSATVTVQNLSYSVTATKSISADTLATPETPAQQIEGNARTATVILTGQPGGNVRTTDMLFEDISPSFWNAYNFTGFGSHSFSSPINRVKVDVLVGVDYVVDGGTNSIAVECNGSSDLEACWVEGTFASTIALPTLPGGVTTSDIRGLRVHYTRADGASWERPYNPTQTVRFTVERRELLVEPSDVPVPSTLYIYTQPAPGEAEVGVFTNEVVVTGWADESTGSPMWIDDDNDSKQILIQHRPAKVQVVKTPFGPLTLGAPIPYEIELQNLGTGLDKQLTGLVIVDEIPVDAQGPQLVTGTDPETGLAYDPQDIVEIEVVNHLGAAVTAPSFTAVLGTAGPSGGVQPLTITIDPAFELQHGWTMTIAAPLQFRQFFEAGSDTENFVLNRAVVTSDQEFDECRYGIDGTLQDPEYEVSSCTSSTRVWALPSAPMNIVKGVKGIEAGPLDAAGSPLIDPETSEPYDDLGVIKTVASNPATCEEPTLDVAGESYYRYPCVPITRPGAEEEWVGDFFNAGNVRVYEIASIDVLPRENDRGVIINDARSSRWAPVLLERPRLIGYDDRALSVYYTDRLDMATPACNGADIQDELGMSPSSTPPMVEAYWPCLSSGDAGGLPDREGANGWQLMPADPSAALLESVTAMKFVIDFEVEGVSPVGLAPGESVTVAYRTRTALEPALRETDANLARDSIAYNSIAGAARGYDGVDDLPYRFVTEPRKVGVALATGALELSKVVDGAASAFAPDDFDVDVSCTVNDEPISLLDSNGNDRSPFTLTGNASSTRVLGIPLYAECTVSEVGTFGATSTEYSDQTLVVQGFDKVGVSTVVNPNPAVVDLPAVESSTITNTYDEASLTVTKTVEMNGAENADGDPLMMTGFTFSIACTFDDGSGASPITVTPASFTLNDGQSRTFTGLPAGAVCTVVETQTRSATVTKVVTTGGSVAAPTSGATAVVTLAPDTTEGEPTNAVDYTNSIAVGSLTVTKAITGAGAAEYGDGTFTVLVSCSRTGIAIVDPETGATSATTPANRSWYGTLTFSADTQLSQTISNIPAGSSCAITEQQSAGATEVTNPTNVSIVGGTTVSRTVTNRFDLASLSIEKLVDTSAEDQNGEPVHPADPFLFDVDCTFQGETVLATGYSASPMTFSLFHDESQLLEGLPAGASCTVTETESRDADSTAIAITVGGTTSAATGPTTTIASLAADGGTVGDPVARNATVFTNLYGISQFTIEKQAIGGAAAQFAPDTITAAIYCVTADNQVAFDDDVTVPVPGIATVPNLAEGSTCRVFERGVDATGVDAHRIVDAEGTVISTEQSVDGEGLVQVADDIVVTADDPGLVVLENYYLTGELEVSKSVVGLGASYGAGPFEVTLECVRDEQDIAIDGGATRSFSGGETVTYSLLPSGAECTLTETDPAGATSSVIVDAGGSQLTDDVTEGYTFTVAVDGTILEDDQPQPALGVENTFELASISISKSVTSSAVDHNDAVIDYGPFPVEVSCLFEGQPVFGSDSDIDYDAETPMTRSLVAGDAPWVLTGLPHGALCTVTETDAMDAPETTIEVVVDSGLPTQTDGTTVDVVVGSATEIAIENSYSVGSIELSKSVVGLGRDAWGAAEFTVDVSCVLDDSTGARTVWEGAFTFDRDSGSQRIDNLATGAVCTVTESSTGGASSTAIISGETTTQGTTADVVVTDALVDVVVENRFDLGEVEVVKVRDGEGSDIWGAGPFEVELSCERTVNGETAAIEIPGGSVRSLSNDTLYSARYEGLPRDAVCTVAETVTAGATRTSIDVDSVVVGAEPVGFEITNTFDVGSVRIDKTFEGDGTALLDRGNYEAQLSCTLVIDGVETQLEIPGGAARELTSLNGFTNSWESIPAGADCVVTESRSGGATRVEVRDGEFTVVADEEHVVTLTNWFLLASFTITKDVTGPMAANNVDSTFVIETSCLWNVDGVWEEVLDETELRHQIRHGQVVTFENLPAAAECSINEVDDGGATAQLVWMAGAPVIGDVVLAEQANDSTLSNVFLPSLAETGFELVLWLQAVAALIFAGLLLLTIARRRAAAES